MPVSGSSAITEQLYKLSPGRPAPSQSGPGFPVPQYVRFSSGSYEPVTQIGAPPCIHESPPHVSWPASPGPGTVLKRQTSLPVLTPPAAMKPRTPNSPPAVPAITLSFTTRGATVNAYPSFGSPAGSV